MRQTEEQAGAAPEQEPVRTATPERKEGSGPEGRESTAAGGDVVDTESRDPPNGEVQVRQIAAG